ITLIIMLMAARWSSVGSIIIGSIATLIGAAFLVVPQIVADFLESQAMIFDRLGQFGMNIHDHLVSDGHSGRLLLYGITFIFVGVVSHGARRQGRRDRKSTRLNSSHVSISYAVFCLKKKKEMTKQSKEYVITK